MEIVKGNEVVEGQEGKPIDAPEVKPQEKDVISIHPNTTARLINMAKILNEVENNIRIVHATMLEALGKSGQQYNFSNDFTKLIEV